MEIIFNELIREFPCKHFIFAFNSQPHRYPIEVHSARDEFSEHSKYQLAKWDETVHGEETLYISNCIESCFAWESTRKLKIEFQINLLRMNLPPETAQDEHIRAPTNNVNASIKWNEREASVKENSKATEPARREKSTMNSNHRHDHPNEPVFYARTNKTIELLLTNKQRRESVEHANNRHEKSKSKGEGRKERDTETLLETRLDYGKTKRRQSSSLHDEREDSMRTTHPPIQWKFQCCETSDDIALDSRRRIKRRFQLFNIFFAYKNRLTDGLARLQHTQQPPARWQTLKRRVEWDETAWNSWKHLIIIESSEQSGLNMNFNWTPRRRREAMKFYWQ